MAVTQTGQGDSLLMQAVHGHRDMVVLGSSLRALSALQGRISGTGLEQPSALPPV